MIPVTSEDASSELWMKIIKECQHEVATLDPHPYYVAAYCEEEFNYWACIPRWLYTDLSKHRPDNCLDIGCAYGTLLLYVQKLSECEAYGTDFVSTYISSKLIATHDLHFCVNNIELDPFPWDCRYDVIIFTEVLEHLNFFPVPTLKKIRDLMHKNGRLYMSTPDATAWGKAFKYYSSYKEMPLPSPELRIKVVDDHVWLFSREELLEVIHAAGLRVLRFDLAPGISGQHFNLTLAKI